MAGTDVRSRRNDVCIVTTLQKIEARRWNPVKEAFQDYAMDRIALMQGMQFPLDESIHLLLSGIESPAIRATAAGMEVTSTTNS
jgi:hypothetical protein